MKYYKVLAKCGHVGRNNYILKWFYVKAQDGKEAAKKVRFTPRVKHDHKDAIIDVIDINIDDYIKGIKAMSSDMYFKVDNSTDQRLYNCIKKEDLLPEEEKTKYKKKGIGRRLRDEYLDREWKKEIQGGIAYDR